MSTPRHRRLRDSLTRIAPRADEVLAVFCRTLLPARPHLRASFPPRLTERPEGLLHLLQTVAGQLEPAADTGAAAGEYCWDASLGVSRSLYPVVRDHLVDALATVHGSPWNLELASDWTEALDAVSEPTLVPRAPEDQPV